MVLTRGEIVPAGDSAMGSGMQRIYLCSLTPEEYATSCAHLRVIPDEACPRCSQAGPLQGHGSYARGITAATGKVMSIRIARFLCLSCGRTISYLPSFALSYRPVQAATVEAFLEGRYERRDVQAWADLLRQYRRRMLAYGSELWPAISGEFGRCRAPPPGSTLWPYLKEAYGSLAAATRRLVTQFKITLFARYQCHQPAAAG